MINEMYNIVALKGKEDQKEIKVCYELCVRIQRKQINIL